MYFDHRFLGYKVNCLATQNHVKAMIANVCFSFCFRLLSVILLFPTFESQTVIR